MEWEVNINEMILVAQEAVNNPNFKLPVDVPEEDEDGIPREYQDLVVQMAAHKYMEAIR